MVLGKHLSSSFVVLFVVQKQMLITEFGGKPGLLKIDQMMSVVGSRYSCTHHKAQLALQCECETFFGVVKPF